MKILVSLLLLLTAPVTFSQPAAGEGVVCGSLTFESLVFWGEVAIPAGHYTLAVEFKTVTVKVTLRSEQGKVTLFTPVGILAGFESGQNQVCLTFQNERWEVLSVNLPQLGLSLLFVPRNRQGNRVTPRSTCVPIAMNGSNGA